MGCPVRTSPQSEEVPESKFPSGKISGLMFGDYYWYYRWHQDQISDTNPTAVEGQHGLWFRRLYFTYDVAFSEKLNTRFRLEMNSNGEFTGGDLVPYVKDAYLRWTYTGKQQLTLGIHPTLTFDWLEGFWGLRHIEKSHRRSLSTRCVARFRIQRRRPHARQRPQLRRAVRQRVGQRLRNKDGQDPPIRKSL